MKLPLEAIQAQLFLMLLAGYGKLVFPGRSVWEFAPKRMSITGVIRRIKVWCFVLLNVLKDLKQRNQSLLALCWSMTNCGGGVKSLLEPQERRLFPKFLKLGSHSAEVGASTCVYR